MENNDKYIAKSWIDDGAEEGFKKSFLESLLNQWQGEGNGFNADKLDGKHYCQIINEVDDKTKGLLPSFQIGNVHFNRDNIALNSGILKIGFDGVQLNVPNEDGYENYQKLPWDEEGKVRSGEPNLLNAFKELYDIVNTKLDSKYQGDIEDFIEFKKELDKSITHDSKGNLMINAQSLNGIRLFVKTPAAYQELKEQAEADEESDAAKLIYDPHNLFIINDGSDIPEDIYAQQPGTQVISSYYQFKTTKKTIINEQGLEVEERWLQYKHADEDDNSWHDICPAEDFIDEDLLTHYLIEILGSNSNYNLNVDSFIRTLKKISFDDGNTYPISDYIRWSGIRGLTQSIYDDVTLDSTPSKDDENTYGVPRYINLDGLLTKIEQVINQKVKENWKKIYPVGAIFISYDNINPNTVFGGTWEKIKGRFLIGEGTVKDETKTRYTFQTTELERTGGEVKHKLKTNEMPSHNHEQDSHSHLPSDTNYYFLVTKNQNNNSAGNWWQTDFIAGLVGKFRSYSVDAYGVMGSSDAAWINENKTTYGAQPFIGFRGDGDLHNNMPPYVVVYIWRRTA